MMLLAWCLADSTRYIYYGFSVLREIATSAKGVAVALKMLKVKSVEKADDPVFAIPFPVVWLRYSLFIVLYPTGVLGEMMTIWNNMGCLLKPMASAQPATVSAFTIQTMRFIFHGWTFWPVLGVNYLAYIVGLPALYTMLLARRRKTIGTGLFGGKPRSEKDKKL